MATAMETDLAVDLATLFIKILTRLTDLAFADQTTRRYRIG